MDWGRGGGGGGENLRIPKLDQYQFQAWMRNGYAGHEWFQHPQHIKTKNKTKNHLLQKMLLLRFYWWIKGNNPGKRGWSGPDKPKKGGELKTNLLLLKTVNKQWKIEHDNETRKSAQVTNWSWPGQYLWTLKSKPCPCSAHALYGLHMCRCMCVHMCACVCVCMCVFLVLFTFIDSIGLYYVPWADIR